jgi:hypothetical protein
MMTMAAAPAAAAAATTTTMKCWNCGGEFEKTRNYLGDLGCSEMWDYDHGKEVCRYYLWECKNCHIAIHRKEKVEHSL